MELGMNWTSRIANQIVSRANNKRRRILSTANAEAMRISSVNMDKANTRRKEINALCLEKAKELLEQTRKKADIAGRTIIETSENDLVDSVFLKTREVLSSFQIDDLDSVMRKLKETETVRVKGQLFQNRHEQ